MSNFLVYFGIVYFVGTSMKLSLNGSNCSLALLLSNFSTCSLLYNFLLPMIHAIQSKNVFLE